MTSYAPRLSLFGPQCSAEMWPLLGSMAAVSLSWTGGSVAVSCRRERRGGGIGEGV